MRSRRGSGATEAPPTASGHARSAAAAGRAVHASPRIVGDRARFESTDRTLEASPAVEASIARGTEPTILAALGTESPGRRPPEPAVELESRLQLDILPQPDDRTCGPTCLHAVYRYYGDPISLDEVIANVPQIPTGGTVDVMLAIHALKRGYRAKLYTYNLRIFDPTWFTTPGVDLADRLRRQRDAKQVPKVTMLSDAYLEFLELGGQIRFQDMSAKLIRKYLRRGVPLLTGLSATYLYRAAREWGPRDDPDDIRGEPQGHFVVLCGYHPDPRSVMVADPYLQNPLAPGHHYEVPLERVVGAVMLGVLTHDANLLLIETRADHA